MAAENLSRLYSACLDGNLNTVREVLPRISVKDLNRLVSDGRTCLHAALNRNHREIARCLIQNGASCRIKDENGQTCLDIVDQRDREEIFVRQDKERMEHFCDDTNASSNSKRVNSYVFGRDKAASYSRAIHRGCVKDRGVKKTVKKIERANFIPAEGDDQSEKSKKLRYYLDEARETNDPTYLIKAYTLDSLFYVEITHYMTEGGMKKVYKRLCHKWTGYFTGSIMKNPALNKYRSTGITYRGMIISRANKKYYQPGNYITNTLFQSTSRKLAVAMNFTQRDRREDEVSVVIRYDIRNPKSALDIKDLSEYPDEEEVLLLPGVLFVVDIAHTDREPWQISAHESLWMNE